MVHGSFLADQQAGTKRRELPLGYRHKTYSTDSPTL